MTAHPGSNPASTGGGAPPVMRGAGPLAGYRGIVLTQAWAGAYCTELLAMMGAELIQVEVRRRLDSWRGPYDGPLPAALQEITTAEHAWNCNPSYNSVNLGKQCITIDLSIPEGLEVFRRLVPLADFVVENFSPRVLGNLGIAYDDLRELRPDIILCSLSAYGGDGPWRNIPGIGGTIEPTSGMSALLGYRDGPPLNSGIMYPDGVAGLNGFAAIATALRHRNRSGEGQYIDLSMQETNLAWVGDAYLEQALNGVQRPRLGSRHMTYAPHNIYRAADREDGEPQWVAIAAQSDEQWRALAEVAEHVEWCDDARFAGNEARKQHEDELDAAIGEWAALQPRDELVARLGAAGVIAAPVLDAHEVAADPVLRERGFIVELDHPEAGRWPQSGIPMRFSGTPVEVTAPAPLQGEHNEAVFERLLGIDAEQYEALVRLGVTGRGEPE